MPDTGDPPTDTHSPSGADRDYVGEMNNLVAAETGHGPYVSRIVAEHVVAKLRALDPDLLNGWLQVGAEQFVWQMINDRDRSTRARARAAKPRTAFAEAAEKYATGDASALDGWLDVPYTLDGGTRKRMGDLTSDDLLEVAASYETRAANNRLEAMWLRAIAKRVGSGKVADHFTDDQLADMRASLTGQ